MFKLIFYFLSVVCSFCMLEKLLLLPPFSGTCVIIFPFFQGIKYRLFFNRGMKIEEKKLDYNNTRLFWSNGNWFWIRENNWWKVCRYFLAVLMKKDWNEILQSWCERPEEAYFCVFSRTFYPYEERSLMSNTP